MASDTVDLPVEGGPAVENPPSPIKDDWQRWNDYGIGLFLEGADKGGQKGELKQAEPVFQKVAELGKADGWVNLARVYLREGRIPDARDALEKAAAAQEARRPLGHHLADRPDQRPQRPTSTRRSPATSRCSPRRSPPGASTSACDYEVINALGIVLYSRARREPPDEPRARRRSLEKSIAAYRRTLAIDSENVAAHYGLGLAYAELAARPSPRRRRRPPSPADARRPPRR